MEKELGFVTEISGKMREHNFVFSYRGKISQETIKALLNLTEKKLSTEVAEIAVKKKVFNVMVECLQNISKHNTKNKYANESIFMIGSYEGKYVVYSGNVIENEKVQALKNKLQAINVMSKEEISELHKRLLVEGSLNEGIGASLGIVDIAKKSGNKLDFSFVEENDKTYFALKTFINNN